MTSIYDLSWNKASFLAKLQLFFRSQSCEKQKMQSDDLEVQAQGYSALSSTYYSIAGTAFSQLKATIRPRWLMWLAPFRMVVWGFTWFPVATWCYWRALPLSNRVVKLIGYERMSADQCDVRQSILRHRGNFEEAKKCIHAALAKNPEKAHTRGLLHVGLADIYRKDGNWRDVEVGVWSAITEANKAEKEDPRQAARIYRHCADIYDSFETKDQIPGSQLRHKAETLLQIVSAKDQLLKL